MRKLLTRADANGAVHEDLAIYNCTRFAIIQTCFPDIRLGRHLTPYKLYLPEVLLMLLNNLLAFLSVREVQLHEMSFLSNCSNPFFVQSLSMSGPL
jgi:hypothetical protein